MSHFDCCHLYGRATGKTHARGERGLRARAHEGHLPVHEGIVAYEGDEEWKISGTWDFKWPLGTCIRVAFQELPEAYRAVDFARGKALVIAKLQAWLNGRPTAGIAAPNLDFTVVNKHLPPPPPAEPGRLSDARSADGEVVDYDVLVSFLPLPVLLPATEQFPKQQQVGTNASELGRYAQRIDYGVPTVFLGPQFEVAFDRWFYELEGIFAVVHELGHVLGFPHEQQNPKAKNLQWKTPSEMAEIVRARGGLAPDMSVEDFLEHEVTSRWPGAHRFSDWRDPPAEVNSPFDSVMAKPSYRCLLRGGHPEGTCTPSGCVHLNDDMARLTAPTDSDLRHLVTMYGARATVEVEKETEDASLDGDPSMFPHPAAAQ